LFAYSEPAFFPLPSLLEAAPAVHQPAMSEAAETSLVQAKTAVKQQAYYMKRALDQRHLRTALQHAATMLGELRTGALGPKAYYDLYMGVTTELRHLEDYFESERARGRPVLELYELVQHAGNVLPRLYLLLAVGGVYIGSKEAPAKEILTDLVEMCRGVQQPLRGLFLRNYLLQITKDKLPDAGSDYEGDGGDVADAIAFVLNNFGEMTKLWVRRVIKRDLTTNLKLTYLGLTYLRLTNFRH